MLENVTFQISDLDNWLNNISIFLQLTASFLIAFFTIYYTQYLRDKREFEANIEWFMIEGAYLRVCLTHILKKEITNALTDLGSDSTSKMKPLICFPDFSLNSYDSIISKGYSDVWTIEGIKNLTIIKHHIQQLTYLQSSFNLFFSIPSSEISVEQYNRQMRIILTRIIDEIDSTTKDWDELQLPKYPKIFISNLSTFFKKIHNPTEKI